MHDEDSGWMRWRLTIAALLVVAGSLAMLAVWPDEPLVQGLAVSLVTTGALTILFDRLIRPGYHQQISGATRQALDEMHMVIGDQNDQISSTVREALDQMPEIVGRQIHAAPSRIYPAHNDPDPGINRDIMRCMLDSSRYLFQGVSGKYVGVRLPDPPDTRPAEIRLVLLDPRDERGLWMRALERQHDPLFRGKGKTPEDHKDGVRDDIRRSVVSLFDHRRFHGVHIGFAAHTALMTLEVFDQAAFVRAWPDGANRSTYPETYRFERTSPMYELLQRTFSTQLRQCPFDLQMKADWQDEQLIAELRELGYKDYSTEGLAHDRQLIAAFREEYRTQL